MRFDLHQDRNVFVVVHVFMRLWLREETASLPTLHYRRIVFVSGENVFRAHFECVLDHFKQRLRLYFTVDGPVGVKNFVTAVL